jgi:hypothetical protein
MKRHAMRLAARELLDSLLLQTPMGQAEQPGVKALSSFLRLSYGPLTKTGENASRCNAYQTWIEKGG